MNCVTNNMLILYNLILLKMSSSQNEIISDFLNKSFEKKSKEYIKNILLNDESCINSSSQTYNMWLNLFAYRFLFNNEKLTMWYNNLKNVIITKFKIINQKKISKFNGNNKMNAYDNIIMFFENHKSSDQAITDKFYFIWTLSNNNSFL